MFSIGKSSIGSERFGQETQRTLGFYARRTALSGAIVGGHLLILFLALHSSELVTKPAAERLLSIDISAATEPSLPATPAVKPQVSKVVTVQLVRRNHNTVPVPPTAGGSGSGSGCAMTAAVARAISVNPDAMAALAALPDSVRSEADAVMLWNGEWMPSDEPHPLVPLSPAHPLEPLKHVVLEAVRSSPPECQAVETVGPQLIPIAEPERVTMLVVGSGVWRWATLIEQEDAATAATVLRTNPQEGFWPIGFPFTGN